MNAERRHEIENLINETEELRRQVDIKLDGGDPKYKDSVEWQRAIADLTDKITDLATEERDVLEASEADGHKENEEYDSLMGAVVHLEHALEDCNAALDAIADDDDFEEAQEGLTSAVDQLTKAIN